MSLCRRMAPSGLPTNKLKRFVGSTGMENTLGQSVAVEKGRELIVEAEAEYRFRRRGLFVSLGFMILLVLAIYLKIRQVESGG